MKALWLICATCFVLLTEFLISDYTHLKVQREMIEEAKAARKVLEHLHLQSDPQLTTSQPQNFL
jgi:hypothetical protein